MLRFTPRLRLQQLNNFNSIHGNVLLSTSPISQQLTETIISTSTTSPSFFSTYQYVSDLVHLCENLLPYECEKAVGRILLLSETTYLPMPLPDTQYFKWWDDVEEFVNSATKSESESESESETKLSTKNKFKLTKLGQNSLLKITHPLTTISANSRPNSDVASFVVDKLLKLKLSPPHLKRVLVAHGRKRAQTSFPLPLSSIEFSHDTILPTSKPDKKTIYDRRHYDIQTDEHFAVDSWFQTIMTDVSTSSTSTSTSTPSFLFSGFGTGLLSSKVAHHYQQSTVVTVRSHDTRYTNQHNKLNDFLSIKNNWITHGLLDQKVLSAIVDGDNVFDFHVGGTDNFMNAFIDAIAGEGGGGGGGEGGGEGEGCNLDNFDLHIARLLSVSKTTYLHLPFMEVLEEGLSLIGKTAECGSSLKSWGGGGEAKQSGIEPTVSMLKHAVSAYGTSAPVTVEYLSFSGSGALVKVQFEPKKAKQQQQGSSLYNLLHLGLSKSSASSQRAIKLFLAFSLDEKASPTVEPWNIILEADKMTIANSQISSSSITDVVWSAIKSNIDKDDSLETKKNGKGKDAYKFSFLEVGGGAIGKLAAQTYADSTVVSVLEDDDVANAVTQQIVDTEQWNHVLCTSGNSARVEDLALHLYESPELMRYSYFDGVEVYEDSTKKQFGKIIGNLFSSSLTSFVKIPTAKQVSLAWELFFSPPPAMDGQPNSKKANKQNFDIARHPTKFFENFEHMFLATSSNPSSVEGFTNVKISNGNKNVPLVRVDITNATRPVHHHYDFKKDGHKRTYTMHIEAKTEQQLKRGGGGDAKNLHLNNGLRTSVFLTRDGDHHFIPYESIKSVTLIAVLRMGLVKALKQRAYKEFINMPLYEDMAPWNIVYDGKSLNYIDFDTKDKTFDAFVPHAYQVMSVLMNYKRTVKDFEHCGDKASTPYGFGLISDCVKSEFKGPCEDPALIVPCSTKVGSCQPDYISCLKAIVNEGDDDGGGDGGGGEGQKEGELLGGEFGKLDGDNLQFGS